jgi:hypothetical protein
MSPVERSPRANGYFLRCAPLGERDIKNAWAGRVFYTLDDYPFVERRHGGRVITFAAPSDHGNSLALRIGQLGLAAAESSLAYRFTGHPPQLRCG